MHPNNQPYSSSTSSSSLTYYSNRSSQKSTDEQYDLILEYILLGKKALPVFQLNAEELKALTEKLILKMRRISDEEIDNRLKLAMSSLISNSKEKINFTNWPLALDDHEQNRFWNIVLDNFQYVDIPKDMPGKAQFARDLLNNIAAISMNKEMPVIKNLLLKTIDILVDQVGLRIEEIQASATQQKFEVLNYIHLPNYQHGLSKGNGSHFRELLNNALESKKQAIVLKK